MSSYDDHSPALRHDTGFPSPNTNDTVTLTPSKKVQALLAQFSDSDSENESPDIRSRPTTLKKITARSVSPSSESDEAQPRGRLAARLFDGLDSEKRDRFNTDLQVTTKTAEPAPKPTVPSTIQAPSAPSNIESSDDDIAAIVPRRKQSIQSDNGSSAEDSNKNQSARSNSPLFFPSPARSRHDEADHSPEKSNQNVRSKFLALVEKHRKERLAREAAEVAKRAVGENESGNHAIRKARGSSPADDSAEDAESVDDDAVKRIQKQARPTRKASRKALEEMNRETQRMSRNMQLTHQAKTKKKITKESLLARFNFQNPAAATTTTTSERVTSGHETATSHSAAASDSESNRTHQSTPPTSPVNPPLNLLKEVEQPLVMDVANSSTADVVAAEMHGALIDTVSDEHARSRGMRKLLEYQDHNTTIISPKVKQVILPPVNISSDSKAQERSKVQSKVTKFEPSVILAEHSESDDEIEIIKDRGTKRKYAAFETLPKRKAKEMLSHLALRSLAHVVANDSKKHSTNAAELDASLRRRARLQAIEERQTKIEELRAKGVIIQTTEERERDQQEVEDLVERARQEAAEIQKREKQIAKKDGTYVKDTLDDGDDEDDSDDGDFEDEIEVSDGSNSDDEEANGDEIDRNTSEHEKQDLVDGLAEEDTHDGCTDRDSGEDQIGSEGNKPASDRPIKTPRLVRKIRVISDDEESEEEKGATFSGLDSATATVLPTRTPRSIPRSARKMIPGLQMSDDLPLNLSQAFAATMADSQSQAEPQTQRKDSLNVLVDLPTPQLDAFPVLQRLESLDVVMDSQPSASQTQPLDINLFSQSQVVPESPQTTKAITTQNTPSQRQIPFELTQDNGYVLSPFLGNRFAETPIDKAPYSTLDTVLLPDEPENSPIVQRRGKLQRGGATYAEQELRTGGTATAFQLMQQAAKRRMNEPDFDKKKSDARKIVDEAAEESEDEYAGLGGVSDDSGDDEENEDDRRMIDEDTQVGKGDEAKLAGLYADRERERDEKEVSKLLKDITTGALRRKRGAGDDLDLSDEEDAAARRREAKRREFARMRRELLKDEAVGKIADDKKKEAFVRSIEDHDLADDDNDDEGFEESEPSTEFQSQQQGSEEAITDKRSAQGPLRIVSDSNINRLTGMPRRVNRHLNRKPTTLAEIRDSVSFLVEEPDSQAATVDLGLSDSEDEPEAYVNLDRHLKEAEAHETALDEDEEDLGDFIVDDNERAGKQDTKNVVFKKPETPPPERAPFSQRRTKAHDVVDRLSLLRQASSSTSSSNTTKMAFFSAKAGGSFSGIPSLLRRATTNSSLGSMSGRDSVSATGVTTSKMERGSTNEEKEFVRKGNGGRRNAVNYQAERKTLREEKMSARAGISKTSKNKKGQGFLGGLFRGNSWE